MSAKLQRLRFTYSRDSAARFISHLDMMRFWERALRRAHLPVSYSEGFTPHAQIALAAPLSVGMTSEGELLDVFLSERLEPAEARSRLAAQLPLSFNLLSVEELDVGAPSAQALLQAVEYRFTLTADTDITALRERIEAFLAADSVPWEHRREKDVKRYDLRPLVQSLRLVVSNGTPTLEAVLGAAEGASARPDQVAAALGIADDQRTIHRVCLLLRQPVSAQG